MKLQPVIDFFRPDPKKKRIKLKPKERAILKKKLYYMRAKGCCEECGRFVPLTLSGGGWDSDFCAHMHEKRTRGAGGDESEENCMILCPECHREKHS